MQKQYRLEDYTGGELRHLLIYCDQFPQDFPPYNFSITGSLEERYMKSSWGMHQAEQPPRYAGNFGYDADNNYRQMLEDLGDRVHPIRHNLIFHTDFQMFLPSKFYPDSNGQTDDIPPSDFLAARLAAVWHDTGENTSEDVEALCGGSVGDIPSGEKTDADRAIERRVLSKIMGTFLADVSDKILGLSIDFATHHPRVLDHPLHTELEISHNWGEYQTGLNAGRLAVEALEDGEEGERVEQLTRIGQVVLPKIFQRLEPHIDDHVLLEVTFTLYQDKHDSILRNLGPLISS